MSVAPELMTMLICPRCRGKLVERTGREGLVCGACRVAYPVDDGMPRLLVEEAQALEAGEVGEAT